jgi:hypothetical protein
VLYRFTVTVFIVPSLARLDVQAPCYKCKRKVTHIRYGREQRHPSTNQQCPQLFAVRDYRKQRTRFLLFPRVAMQRLDSLETLYMSVASVVSGCPRMRSHATGNVFHRDDPLLSLSAVFELGVKHRCNGEAAAPSHAMTDAQWATFNFVSIMAALFRYQGQAVLHPRDHAAIVALLTLTATSRADGSPPRTLECENRVGITHMSNRVMP